MKNRLFLLSLLLAGVAIVMAVVIMISVTATAAPDTSPDNGINVTPAPTRSDDRNSETPERDTPFPRRSSRGDSGEVEYPMMPRGMRTPTIPPTTIPVPPTNPPTTVPVPTTIPPTTVPVPPTNPPTTAPVPPTNPPTTVPAPPPVPPTTIPVPVVTVTVLVYPSGQVYQPVYYYPPYYPYTVNSYYPRGTLTVTSSPPQATVILDGYNTGTTPWIFTGLSTGYHTVEVDYPGYEAYVRSVYIESGASQEVYADLTSLVEYGSFFIESTPPGADVYVDGNYQGTSPVTVGGMAVGPHRIELHLAGYEVLITSRTVAPSQGTVVNLALVPLTSSSGSGSIEITSNPGALVYLDGIYKGSVITGNTFSIISVQPGSHTLLLHLPGYSDFTQTVVVYGGQIAYVNAVFTSTPSGQQTPTTSTPSVGSIIVTSTPAGGQVTVDNQFRGVAPVTIYNVAPGTHIVNMKLGGYSDWSSSVEVPSNQMVHVTATLVPGSATPPVPPGRGLPLSPAAILGALAIGAILISTRFRR